MTALSHQSHKPLLLLIWTRLGHLLENSFRHIPYQQRNRLPIRVSVPIPCLTASTSASRREQRLAISFIKVILVAKKALAAYLVNSADFASMIGFPCLTRGYISALITLLYLNRTHNSRSGFIKSSTATPSRKNSGFETTSKGAFAFLAMALLTLAAVPTTVLLSTTQYNDPTILRAHRRPLKCIVSLRNSSPGGVEGPER